MTETVYDYAAVGIGPANLSLAAQAHRVSGIRGIHLERKPSFSWHPGLLLPEATLQVSPLKDLVTPVDPTSPFTFLNFLAAHDRLYRFLTADFPAVHRTEFNQYLTWVSEQLPSLEFGSEVTAVGFRDGAFRLRAAGREIAARHLVVGTGPVPRVNEAFRPHLGGTVLHASQFLERRPDTADRDVVVVGGGQSGAEIVRHLMTAPRPPKTLTWVSRRPGFLPLDDSPFTNEFFFPAYARRFHALPADHRMRLLDQQKYASDGIDLPTLQEIYRRRYAAEEIEGRRDWLRFLPGCEVTELSGSQGAWKIPLQGDDPLDSQVLDAEVVVLASGYEHRLPPCVSGLLPAGPTPGEPRQVHDDFSVDWSGPAANRIYVQNAARHFWGIADPNLSLLAWRSSTILTSITENQ
ncbi:lysine N(6)-hydroxylase/L-ornithine N(5)-oxygenase family protein [Streptomyces glebosus]|nr:SidA/IucD/PvdA family monooxygenase [Streptomyces glebosus]